MEIVIGALVAAILIWFFMGASKQRNLLNDPKVKNIASELINLSNESGNEIISPAGKNLDQLFKDIPRKDRVRPGHAAYGIAAQGLSDDKKYKIQPYLSKHGIKIL